MEKDLTEREAVFERARLVKAEFLTPAAILCEQKKTSEAVALLLRGLDQFKENGHLLYSLGEIAFAAGDTDRAQDFFQRAVTNFRENEELSFGKRSGVKVRRKTRATLSRLATITNRKLYALLRASISARKEGKPDVAEKNAREAKRLHGGRHTSCELGRVLISKGTPDSFLEARGLFESVLKYTPGFIEALVGLARIARIENKLDEARELLLRAIEADPKDPFIFTALARVEIKAGNFDRAIELAEKAVRLEPDNLKIRFKLTRMRREIEDRRAHPSNGRTATKS